MSHINPFVASATRILFFCPNPTFRFRPSALRFMRGFPLLSLRDIAKSYYYKLISHQKELSQLGGDHVAVFGSIARDEASEVSDVDILVDFDSKKGLFGFADLKFYLEEILGCPVDLVTRQALHPALKTRILNESKKIF